jgi:hypothetical protein
VLRSKSQNRHCPPRQRSVSIDIFTNVISRFISKHTLSVADDTGVTLTNIVVDSFPLALENYYAQDDTSMCLQAAIDYEYDRMRVWKQTKVSINLIRVTSPKLPPVSVYIARLQGSGDTTSASVLSWSNNIKSSADYNRSLDHNTVYVETGSATESFRIADAMPEHMIHSSTSTCYDRYVLLES